MVPVDGFFGIVLGIEEFEGEINCGGRQFVEGKEFGIMVFVIERVVTIWKGGCQGEDERRGGGNREPEALRTRRSSARERFWDEGERW